MLKNNVHTRITDEGVIYVKLNGTRGEIELVFESAIFDLYALNEDGTEALIETYEELDEAMKRWDIDNIEFGIELNETLDELNFI